MPRKRIHPLKGWLNSSVFSSSWRLSSAGLSPHVPDRHSSHKMPTRHRFKEYRHQSIVTIMSNGRNADPAVVAEKKRRIHDPHVTPLNSLADRIADAEGLRHGYVPYVDPDQGGINARVLVLLDNPSTKAEAGTGSSHGVDRARAPVLSTPSQRWEVEP